MPELLVSIRNAEEARIAKLGGANWIDVKEPRKGPLGKAEDQVLEKIAIDNKLSKLSAAMGEIINYSNVSSYNFVLENYSLIKFGTSTADFPTIQQRLTEIARNSQRSPNSIVLAAYADFKRAESPRPDLFPAFCAQEGIEYLLIDTFLKDNSHLFTWLSAQELSCIRGKCAKLGIKLALAGKLGVEHIPALREIDPHIVGLRSAVCDDGIRDNSISLERIQFWKSHIT